MRGALPEHFAVVGPAWLDFERAVRAAGATGEDLNEQLDSLRGRLTPATLDTAHLLRRQRNALFHDGTLIRDLRGWEAQCRQTIADIRSSAKSGARRGSVATRRSPAARSRGTLLGVATVLAIAALAGLGVVAFAWFGAAMVCGDAPDRLGCTFESAGYLPSAVAGIAVATTGVLLLILWRRGR